MQKEFTKEYMLLNRGCYSKEQLLSCSFMKRQMTVNEVKINYPNHALQEIPLITNENITLESIINSEISLKDKYWFVCNILASKEQNQQIAIGVAEIVLEIYENKYPNSKAPREAIQAAKDYLKGIINLDELNVKKSAAYASAAAAYATAAYYAAAAAATAADYAAAAATAADYAAAAAVSAAYYAADAAKKLFKDILLQFLIDFTK
jgi:hypothetical protein